MLCMCIHNPVVLENVCMVSVGTSAVVVSVWYSVVHLGVIVLRNAFHFLGLN